jgi:hypothetical protein
VIQRPVKNSKVGLTVKQVVHVVEIIPIKDPTQHADPQNSSAKR